MLTRVGTRLLRLLDQGSPWTNAYGLARTLIASGTLLTLVFSHSASIFHPALGVDDVPNCLGLASYGLFCSVPPAQLEWARLLAVAGLALVASGFWPRLTGLLHWWIAASLFASGTLVDGGDQAAAVLSLLLLPVTLTDNRRWHWQAPRQESERDLARLLAWSAWWACRVQVALIYFHATVGKLAVREWANGTALYYWLTDPAFGAPGWLMPWLRPALVNGTSVALMTWGVLLLETLLFMALVMPRWAWPRMLVAGLLLHAGIAVVHGLGSFSLTMAGALVLFLRPVDQPFELGAVRRWLAGRLGAAPRTEPEPAGALLPEGGEVRA